MIINDNGDRMRGGKMLEITNETFRCTGTLIENATDYLRY